jgi:hypothetical protein
LRWGWQYICVEQDASKQGWVRSGPSVWCLICSTSKL